MSDSLSYSNMYDLNDINDIELIMQVINQDQHLQGESSRRTRMAVNRDSDVVEALGANNNLTVLNHSSLFDDLLDDIALVVSYEFNVVTFEKGYYLADGIYPQCVTFVKSFTVARAKKNVVFKWRQESARKDVERAFGVLQGRWHIIAQPARGWTINKL
ncbi:ALP1-like protein [Tanacetum coccineum]|uniref:ALP1-like protein n=1 Tax=Tanacetum coccineum TaxID=301880 RepID=A0ABQ5IWZ4_9ASTR